MAKKKHDEGDASRTYNQKKWEEKGLIRLQLDVSREAVKEVEETVRRYPGLYTSRTAYVAEALSFYRYVIELREKGYELTIKMPDEDKDVPFHDTRLDRIRPD